MSVLFRRKPIERIIAESESGEHKLARTLTASNLVLLGIGAIIGAGLFSITGIAAAENAGPAITISFVIAAVGCAFAGLCYAEFSSMIPVAWVQHIPTPLPLWVLCLPGLLVGI